LALTANSSLPQASRIYYSGTPIAFNTGKSGVSLELIPSLSAPVSGASSKR
jgi:hypothetical protein